MTTRIRQRIFLHLFLAAGFGATAIMTIASLAYADPDSGASGLNSGQQQFVNDLASIGIVPTNGDQAMVNEGERLCGEMASGNTREKETNIVRGRIPGANPNQGKAVVDFAVNDLCPGAPPPSAGLDQASAEQAIRDGYVKKLASCYATRNAVANVQSITWDPPGFSPETGGSGTIHDADPRLGGQFLIDYVVGRWNVQYEWC